VILTFKIRHQMDLSEQLSSAMEVARHAISHRDELSTRFVSHLGLPAAISNQILRKYGRNRRCKRVSKVMLTVPGEATRVDHKLRTIRIPCLGMVLPYRFRNDFSKINQVELNGEYAFVAVTIEEPATVEVAGFIGVDLNTTGHSTVVADPATGKVQKFGKSENHIRTQYRNIRRKIQESQRLRNLKRVRRRERRKINDLNHKVSREVVSLADTAGSGIAMEDLGGIRERVNGKSGRKFRGALNNWSFSDLRKKIEYKARLLGIPVVLVNPAYTSKTCSRCGTIGERDGKEFVCHACGHVDHADVNAAFNIGVIASGQKGMSGTGALIPRRGNAGVA